MCIRDSTLTDSLGCDTTESFTIPDFTPITPNLGTTPVSCFGVCDGTATLGPTGGEGPYTFDWAQDPAGDSTNTVTGLCAGVYDVTITDANGCDTTVNVLITSPDAIGTSPAVTPIACNGDCNGTISLNATGGTGNLVFAWTPQPPVGQGSGDVAQPVSYTHLTLPTNREV